MKHSFPFRLLILSIIFLLAGLIFACGSYESMSETGFSHTPPVIEPYIRIFGKRRYKKKTG